MAKVAKFSPAPVIFGIMAALIVPCASAQWVSGGGSNVYTLNNVGVNTNPLGWSGGVAFAVYSASRPYFEIISACSGEGCDPSFAFSLGGSPVGYVGLVAGAGNAIAGSAIGDVYIRSQSGRVLFSIDGGVSQAITVSSTGTNLKGTVTADNMVAKYQDIAEWVSAAKPLDAGTVVILDSSHPNRVTPSEATYDTRVAGVISDKPGVLLGEASPSKEKVSTTGRVRVKVDASFGVIHIGDLLVTSPIEGTAMVSKPVEVGGIAIHRPGTILGKALEPLESGRGEILVLLSLQ